MTSQGSPYTRLQRALSSGNAMLACAAAAEMPTIGLTDAFSLLWLLRHDSRFPRAAARFASRMLNEAQSVTLPEAQLLLAALALLPSELPAGALETVAQLAEQHGLRELHRRVRETHPDGRPRRPFSAAV